MTAETSSMYSHVASCLVITTATLKALTRWLLVARLLHDLCITAGTSNMLQTTQRQ